MHHLPRQISISYASRRNEVWKWYWGAWRRRLWRTHLTIFVVVALCSSLLLYDDVPKGAAAFSIVAVISAMPLIGFVLFPMLKFKPQVRKLNVSKRGIDTTIGEISASVPWQDIAEVRNDGDNLVIQRRNLNAFIVPARAFQTIDAKTQFRDFVLEMVEENGS